MSVAECDYVNACVCECVRKARKLTSNASTLQRSSTAVALLVTAQEVPGSDARHCPHPPPWLKSNKRLAENSLRTSNVVDWRR